MAETKWSMVSTSTPAACTASRGVVGVSPSQALRCSCHSCVTAANASWTTASRGTNRGRVGLPVRSSDRLWSNCATRARSCAGCGSACTALDRRQVCMRMRPASFTAAAPPSSWRVTHRVRPIEVRATTSRPTPMRISFCDSEALARMVVSGSQRRRRREGYLRIRVLLPKSDSMRSTATSAVRLRSSNAGFSSMTSSEARRPVSAIISMHSWASR